MQKAFKKGVYKNPTIKLIMYLEGVSLEFSTTKGGETTLTPIMGTLSQWWVMTFHKSFAAATDINIIQRVEFLFPEFEIS